MRVGREEWLGRYFSQYPRIIPMIPKAHFEWESGYALDKMMNAATASTNAENTILVNICQSCLVSCGRPATSH
jgi:hypothetical protein